MTDFSRISISSLLNGGGEAPRDSDNDGTQQAGCGLRGNRLEDGLRSPLLFPDRMKQLIYERISSYGVQLVARTLLE